jgi:hypothetical protein
VVMEILGHSQIAVTMNTYTHVVDDAQRDAVDSLADAFDGKAYSAQDGGVVKDVVNGEPGTDPENNEGPP